MKPYFRLEQGRRFLNAYGGCWETWGWFPLAPGRSLYYTWQDGSVYTFFGEGGASDRMELRNSKLIVLWGANPA